MKRIHLACTGNRIRPVHALIGVTPNVASAALPALLGFDLPSYFEAPLRRVMGVDAISRLYERARGCPLPESLLRELNVTVKASGADTIPSNGPAVVVANHPYGLLDGAVLAAICMQRRSDVRILANSILAAVPELAATVIPVDVFDERRAQANAASVLQALRHVSDGGLLLIFPAGQVSSPSGDSRWSPLVARLIAAIARKRADLRIIPAFVHGRNGALFHAAGTIHPRLRMALLPRELLRKKGCTVRVESGQPIPAARLLQIDSHEDRIEYLRWRTHLLRGDAGYKPQTKLRVSGRAAPDCSAAPVCPPIAADALEHDITRLPPECLLASTGDLRAYLATANQIPAALRELGRLREITFRAAGEGTGTAADVDRFDAHYLHLFVWNSAGREIVGAYRIGRVDEIRRRAGTNGLYTATLFSFGDRFLDGLGPALELGRSFVRPEYQRTFAPLLLLWKGIGAYVARHPQYKVLFGPVSISNSYSSISRELMVAYLERRSALSELANFVSARNPFRAHRGKLPDSVTLDDISDAIGDIEEAASGVPVLLRQYLKLGGKLVGFNVDPDFANALDGLIVVDLTKTEPRLLGRYLGQTEAKNFLEYQRGENGANQNNRPSELDAADHRRRHPAADTLIQIFRRPRVGLYLLDTWRRAVGQDR